MTFLIHPSISYSLEKEKENMFPVAGPSTRSVAWAPELILHDLSSPPKVESGSSKQRPKAARSILKKTSQCSLFDLPAENKPREVTPAPSELLRDLTYLARPVSQIITQEDPNRLETLRTLIEGYNVLAVRVRDAVAESSEADSTWPLFQPLRQNKAVFVDAVVRDLGRALVDPLSLSPSSGDAMPPSTILSPQKSPERKKGGMTAEQVKYARDLCTICHSVIKTLSVLLSLPALHNLFEETQLRRILGAVLAIPLADSLPTPNARKTCALAIWLIQVQRLPAPILRPAADRVAYAIRRGIDGELGKEGKKGSANDGLKAIADLCKHLPVVFVPAFAKLLPSILRNLLAGTLSLRTQACHALGGFAVALGTQPQSILHTHVAGTIAAFLTAPPSPSKSNSPTKPTENAIVRTIRATMMQSEPEQPAQGPVWGTSVLASLVVLLSSRLSTDAKVSKIIGTLTSLGIRHKRSSVRGLTCLVWRCIIWAYMQSSLPNDSDEESEVDEDEDAQIQSNRARDAHFKLMIRMLDMQTGITVIGAILGDEDALVSDEPLRKALSILQLMASSAGRVAYDAGQVMMQLVSAVNGEGEDPEVWEHNQLIPKQLLTGSGTLFTCELKGLTQAVRGAYEDMPSLIDIRPLTREQLTSDWVIDALMTVWKTTLGFLELPDTAGMPQELGATWSGILKANVHLEGSEDDASIIKFALVAVRYLIEILEDNQLNLVPNQDATGAAGPANAHQAVPDSDDTIIEHFPDNQTCSNNELRLRIVQYMWTEMKVIFPTSTLGDAAETLLACLMRSARVLMTPAAFEAEADEAEASVSAWVTLCMDVVSVCDVDALRTFWACEEGASAQAESGAWGSDWGTAFTNSVWKTCAQVWKADELGYEGGVILLGVPFIDRHPDTLSTSDDFNLWEELLTYTTARAVDHGVDSVSVLDNIASFVSLFQTGAVLSTSMRLADLLLSHLDPDDIRSLPRELIELVADIMRIHYPPVLHNEKQPMRWVMRSLSTLIERCPEEFCSSILKIFQAPLSIWLADEQDVWTNDELTYDLVPVYEHILLKIQRCPISSKTIETFSSYMGSVFSHRTVPAAVDAFSNAWTMTFSHVPRPDEGWSKPLQHALDTVFPPEVEKKATASSFLAPAFDAPPTTPSASTSITPVTKRSAVQSPQRPQKLFGNFPIVPSSPISPTVKRRSRPSSSTSNTPRTPLSAIQATGTPLKRRRLSNNVAVDKENVGLKSGPVVSVAERIATLMNSGGNPRKRKLDTMEDSDSSCVPTPVPVKKLRSKMKSKSHKSAVSGGMSPSLVCGTPLSCSDSDEERRQVESSLLPNLIPFPTLEAKDVEDVKFPSSRTPTLSLDNPAPKRLDFTKLCRTVKRSVSTPSAMRSAIKRKRIENDLDDDTDLYDLTKPNPIPALHIAPLFTAKRSVSMPFKRAVRWQDSDATVVSLSSEDHSKLGQVTPHDIMYPKKGFHFGASLKSLQLEVDDNTETLFDTFGSDDSSHGSDDSNVSDDSPTKEVVSRQLHRAHSDGRLARAIVGQ